MVTPRFIPVPFAATGDRVEVPVAVDPGGSVSYSQGFGPAYEIAPGSPGTKPVPREETNSLYYDLSDNIRQYQLVGTPPWHPAADNNGVAIAYPIGARVYHVNKVWRSILASNTVEPGTDPTAWLEDVQFGPASTTVLGVVRYATTAEALARVATDRAVTPAGLGAVFDLLKNNPVFPEVDGSGRFSVTALTGAVRVAAGTSWTMRGAFRFTSSQVDLPTVASKTYHLRWTEAAGFALYDLSSGAYNPSAVPETDPSFDSTFDDMLVARVVTSSGNVATVTGLLNKNRLLASISLSGTSRSAPGQNGALWDYSTTYDWARTPMSRSLTEIWRGAVGVDRDLITYSPYPTQVSNVPGTRYGAVFTRMDDHVASSILALSLTA